MTHKQTIEYIKSCGNQVTFTIDPTILMPRYAVPPPLHNGTVAGPIEAEDAVYTSNNGTLTNGHNEHDSHLHSNGNIVVGAGLSYLNKDDKVSVLNIGYHHNLLRTTTSSRWSCLVAPRTLASR